MLARKWIKTVRGEDFTTLVADHGSARLWFLSDDVIRFRLSCDGIFEEASYALVTTAWEDRLDPLFSKERTRIKALSPEMAENEDEIRFSTKHLTLVVRKNPFSLALLDAAGKEFYEDLSFRAYEIDQLGRVAHYSKIDERHDHFYGFGEKNGKLDKKGFRMRQSPRDAIATDPESGDPMYKHIPFYIRTNDQDRHALGLFYNNSYDCVFDMGNERSGYWDRYCYWQADGGDIDLFLINGPSVKQVVSRYTWLTGRTIMPTKQSLGFIDSTMYYAELPRDCDKEILGVIDKFSEEDIPLDGFWLASGYTAGEDDGLRYTFHWNLRRFPDPEDFIHSVESKGVQVIPNTKPGIRPRHPYRDRFEKADAFVKDPEGKEAYVGRWWGGAGRFVDFTSSRGRETWAKLQKEALLSKGIHTIWNDNCEYDGVEDRNARCDKEGMGGTMAELKIIQSNMMALMACDALRDFYPGERPYVTNRAGYAGIQRYAQVWGGDNVTDWRTLKYNVALILGMGLSGVSNTGCDIGGFAGPAPSGELLLRWFQNGIFQPRFCLNSANSDNTVTQPWSYPEHLSLIREAFRLRYRLFPYLYSLMAQSHTDGIPAWRTLFMEFPDDPACLEDESLTFLFGPSLLVANVLEQGAKERSLYLPAGTFWYDVNDHYRRYEGGCAITIPVSLSTIPMFLRGGAILVSSRDIRHSTKDVAKTLEVTITPESDSSFTLYDDDGHTEAFQKGNYAETKITVESGERVKIHFSTTGDYPLSWNRLELRVMRKDKGAFFVEVDGLRISQFLSVDDWETNKEGWVYDLSDRFVRIKLDRPERRDFEILVSFEKFDLIGMGLPLRAMMAHNEVSSGNGYHH